MRLRSIVTAICLTLLWLPAPVSAQVGANYRPNGFDLGAASVPRGSIISGGPARDGIPALSNPSFISAEQADYLKEEDLVVGVALNDQAKAYPVRLLRWHEIVNDKVGDKNLAVTYCPLTGSAVVIDRDQVPNAPQMGVSGLLYQSNILFYDRDSDSLWSQLAGRALAGPQTGAQFKTAPSSLVSWHQWKQRYPKTLVLSSNTGYERDLERNPYAGYGDSAALWFPVSHRDSRLPPKTRVIGIELSGQAKAWNLTKLLDKEQPVHARLGDTEVVVDARWNRVLSADGKELPSVVAYWFAWAAFHPKTEMWDGSEANDTGMSAGAGGVLITKTHGSWDDLSTLFMGGGTSATPFSVGSIFVLTGEIKNISDETLDHALLRYELVDEDENVVVTQEGYNRAAENLMEGSATSISPKPLPPGASDSFRMVFFGEETPHFATHRVTVVKAVKR